MKKIVLLTAAALLLRFMPAHATAEFFLKINRSGRYSVYFADQRQYTPANQFRFFDMNAGTSSIKVIEEYTNRVVYTGAVNLSNGYRTVAELDYNGNLRVLETIQVQQTNWYNSCPGNYYSNGNYGNNNWNTGWGNTGSQYGTTGSTSNSNTYSYNSTGWNGNYGSNSSSNWNNGAVDDNSFSGMKDYVQRQSFDSDKLNAAKEVSRTNKLKSSQVADLCKLFSFDNNRLEYAKYAYDYVVDKNNYYLVSNTFSFSSNANELRDYIATH